MAAGSIAPSRAGIDGNDPARSGALAPCYGPRRMGENALRLPPLLDDLIASGRWPSTSEAALRQNVEPLASVERIAGLAADEERLSLYLPPFQTVADNATAKDFWVEHGGFSQLDPDKALIIGDFGLGSDAPILLDYRAEPEPCVIKLDWSRVGSSSGSGTVWIEIAASFDDFARRLGLV